jgi:hypothetical protein
MLEYAEPRMIRKIIERNRRELERHGTLFHRVTTPPGGGPTATEYWVTFKQAMTICVLSKTAKARNVGAISISRNGSDTSVRVTSGSSSDEDSLNLKSMEFAVRYGKPPASSAGRPGVEFWLNE